MRQLLRRINRQLRLEALEGRDVPATFFATNDTNQLLRFDSTMPSNVQATIQITGLQANEFVEGIDFRPSTESLYALGSTSRLYTINTVTGAATQVGNTFGTPLNGTSFGFDFNPVSDRIRVVSDNGQSLVINPDTGVATASPNLNGLTTSITGSAYTNNFAGATTTTLYGIDPDLDVLVIQNPATSATQIVGLLGVDAQDLVNFDIQSGTGTAFATLNVGGIYGLYNINLTTGAATLVNNFATGTVVTGLSTPFRNQPLPIVAIGQGAGGTNSIIVQDKSGATQFTINNVFPTSVQGVRVATGDVNGDGVADIIAGAGPGGQPSIAIYNGVDGKLLTSFVAFESSFTGGVYVAAGDLNNDGFDDIIITPDQGGGPRVRILAGAAVLTNTTTLTVINDFFGIDDSAFRGGARAGVADLNGDGQLDLVVSAGFGGGPRIAGFEGASLLTGVNGTRTKLFNDFFIFEETLRNGAFVALRGLDFNQDGFDDLTVGGGPTGGPRVRSLSGQALTATNSTQTQLVNFFAGDQSNRGGIRLTTNDLNGDGIADLITGGGDNSTNQVSVYDGTTLTTTGSLTASRTFTPFNTGLTGGVFVG